MAAVVDSTTPATIPQSLGRGRGRGRGNGNPNGHPNGQGRGRARGGSRGRGRGTNHQNANSQTGSASGSGSSSVIPSRNDDKNRRNKPEEVSTSVAPSQSSRRARFNATLTSTTSDARSESSTSVPVIGNSSSTPSTPTTRAIPPPKDNSLLSILSHSLTHAPHPECLICFVAVRPRDSIHSCLVCYKTFHLRCLRDWSQRSVNESKGNVVVGAPPDKEGKWRCPACNSQFGEKEMPGEYRCFCWKMNLGIKAQQEQQGMILRRGKVAHSCNQRCGKIVKNSKGEKACDHPCAHFCHPGPCPPCGIVITPSCHCGAKTLNLRCSTVSLSSTDQLSCNGVCNKLLQCGMHNCTAVCHPGDCPRCTVIRAKRCYCGSSIISAECAEVTGERKACHSPLEVGSWQGEFRCEENCPWIYDCGVHRCMEEGGRCHAHPSREVQKCPRSPEIVKTCPCDHKVPLEILSHEKREKCTDPLITCGGECGRVLPCGHFCRKKCHDGECLAKGEECKEGVSLVCRCGDLKLSEPCAKAHRLMEGRGNLSISPDGQLLCDKVCKCLKACGRHPCNRKCCPLSFQESERLRKKGKWRAISSSRDEAVDDPQGWHKCDLICGKKLACGRHFCEESDHKGPCGRCLNSRFEELICNCGKTILPPPIPCGTSITCSFPCARPAPSCGHDKVPHTCHEDDILCPPCPYLTTKTCQCWRQTQMKNVRCSSERLSCGLACGRFMDCGFHKCPKSCHTGPCGPCSQVCGKSRKFCAHPCDTQCHAPFPCPTTSPCKSVVVVSCACGFVRQKILCNSSDEQPEGNRAKVLKCTDACAVEKRNKAFATALGIDTTKPRTPSQEVEYDDDIMSYYASNRSFCDSIEKTIKDFVESGKATYMFPHQKKQQRYFVHLLAAYFQVESHGIDEEPHRSVMLNRLPTTFIPIPTLGEAYLRRTSGVKNTLTLGNVKDISKEKEKMAEVLPPNAFILEGYHSREKETLVKTLKDLMGKPLDKEFNLVWSDHDLLFYFPGSTVSEETVNLAHVILKSLNESTNFCNDITPTRVDETGKVVWRKGWTEIAKTASSQLKRTLPTYSNIKQQSPLVVNNSFNLLDTKKGPPKPAPNPNSIAGGSWEVLGGGLNRPPSAVVPPLQQERPIPKSNEDVVDSWEDL